MATIRVGEQHKTIAAAIDAAAPGDTVEVPAGTYQERLTIGKPLTLWGEPGAIIDGGWDDKSHAKGYINVILIQNTRDVVVDGLEIRNSPGRGIAMIDAANVTVNGCRIFNTYHGGMLAQSCTNIIVTGNTMRRMSQSWRVGKRDSVNGSFNVLTVTGGLIKGNVLDGGWGEGINLGRGTEDVVVMGNTIANMNHVLLYFNRSQDCIARGNFLYHSPDSEYKNAKSGERSAAIIFGDESGRITGQFPNSTGNVVEDNIVVNAGKLLQVRNNKTNYDTALTDTRIEGNTFIAGPQTLSGITILDNVQGRAHNNSVFKDNVIHFTHAAPKAVLSIIGKQGGIEFSGNAWTTQPVAAMRGPGDIYGDLGLANPAAPLDDGIDLDNYRPLPDSRLIVDGGYIGALAPKDGTPPVDPEPPDEPDPPDEPEPPEPEPLDLTAVREQLAVIGLTLDELWRIVGYE